MMANEIPKCLQKRGPLPERFMRLIFGTDKINDLKEERVIATLWGCRDQTLTQFSKHGCVSKIDLGQSTTIRFAGKGRKNLSLRVRIPQFYDWNVLSI